MSCGDTARSRKVSRRAAELDASWTNVRWARCYVRAPVRAPPATIPAPPFPRGLTWLNVATLRMDKQRGRPVLVEFWDFCRVNSLRTLPYLKAWHERYADAGLRVIGVHTGGVPARRATRPRSARAVERLEIEYPVVIDTELEVWDLYGNEGWPARYLWDPERRAVLDALRRGRLRGDRARDPGAARRRARAGRAGAPRGRAGRCCCPPRPRTSPAPTPARTRRAACGRCVGRAAS